MKMYSTADTPSAAAFLVHVQALERDIATIPNEATVDQAASTLACATATLVEGILKEGLGIEGIFKSSKVTAGKSQRGDANLQLALQVSSQSSSTSSSPSSPEYRIVSTICLENKTPCVLVEHLGELGGGFNFDPTKRLTKEKAILGKVRNVVLSSGVVFLN